MKQIFTISFLLLLTFINATIINVPADQPTIQAGLDVAIECDTVLVAAGTYFENIIWPDINSIVLISELGAEETIIDGSNTSTTIIIGDGSISIIDTTTVIDGFGIKNGLSPNLFDGSGIYANFADPIIQNCIIYDNSGDGNAAILHQGTKAIIRNNVIRDNTFLNGDGGGIYLCVSSADVYDNQIYNNNSQSGGGIGCYKTHNHIISNNEIFNNFALGSAITFSESNCCVENNNIHNNISTGGIAINQSSIEIIGNQIHHNLAIGNGGGIYITSCSAQNSIIYGNDIYANITGGLYSIDEDTLNAENNWWGDESGPYNELLNPNGVGNEVSGEVDFIPWSTEPFFPSSGIEDSDQLSINNSILKQNYPNPFNPTTTISFSVTQNSDFVTLSVYNIKGQLIKALVSNNFDKGDHSVIWNGEDEDGKQVSSGVYLYKLKVNNKNIAIKRCLLLK